MLDFFFLAGFAGGLFVLAGFAGGPPFPLCLGGGLVPFPLCLGGEREGAGACFLDDLDVGLGPRTEREGA